MIARPTKPGHGVSGRSKHRRGGTHWALHGAMLAVSFGMLLPFYWVLKTSLTGENIFVYPPSIIPVQPHPFYYVDVWYYIPFPCYLLNSVIVSLLSVVANVAFNAMEMPCATAVLSPKPPWLNPPNRVMRPLIVPTSSSRSATIRSRSRRSSWGRRVPR